MYYGAEAHLVLNIMVNDTKRLVVLGEKHVAFSTRCTILISNLNKMISR